MVRFMKNFFKQNSSIHRLSTRVVAVAAMLSPAVAYSQANFLIWPIYPVIENNQKAVAVWLENVGDSPATVQVRVFKWSQDQHKEQFSTQQEIIPSPPIVKIPAGTKQMIRLTQAVATPELKENAYRVIVDELPVATDDQNKASSVNFKMRYSIPLFTYGQGIGSGSNQETHKQNARNPLAKPILKWNLAQHEAKEVLEVSNSGAMVARITEFKSAGQSFKAQAANNAYGYVLPNSKIYFNLNADLKNQLLKNNVLEAVVGSKKETVTIEKQ